MMATNLPLIGDPNYYGFVGAPLPEYSPEEWEIPYHLERFRYDTVTIEEINAIDYSDFGRAAFRKQDYFIGLCEGEEACATQDMVPALLEEARKTLLTAEGPLKTALEKMIPIFEYAKQHHTVVAFWF